MKFDTIMNRIDSFVLPANSPPLCLIPRSSLSDIYNCIVDNKLHSCIELGTGYGGTTCVMAAAVDEIGGGVVVTVDKCLHQPANIQMLKNYTGLDKNIEAVVEQLGYNWYLADLVARQTEGDVCQPLFDFCFLDGAHEWEPDALAIFLVAKLLKPGAWIVLDDLNFKLRFCQPNWEKTFGHLSDRELDTCQVGMVYDWVVKQLPDFHNFRITEEGRIGWACKKLYNELQLKIDRVEAELQQTQSELQQTHSKLQESQNLIDAMRSSKFWKVRTAWFKVKKLLGLSRTNS